MNLFNFPIKRPITILMGMIMIMILGGLSWYRMPLDLMPDLDFPNLLVYVRYDGAGPEEVEERLGKILESAIKTTSNIKNVKVNAQEGMCFITAEFNWGTDLDSAAADIREKIAWVRDALPPDMHEPVVFKISFQAMPVMFLHVDDPSGTRNLADLADIANEQIAPRFEALPGVAGAFTLGGLFREIQVNLDQDRLKQFNLSGSDVINAIRYNNLDMTTGHVDYHPYRFRIKGESQFLSREEIENTILGHGLTQSQMQQKSLAALMPYQDPLAGEGAVSPIRIRDVAEVVDTYKDREGLFRIVKQGKEPIEGVGMAVMKETDANIVDVAQTVIRSLDSIRESLPAGVNVDVSFDLSEIVTDSLVALANHALEGAVMATLVIFLFLWKIRPSLIVVTAIPLSLLACFIAMFFSGYTLNIMTLGGMVIAVGKLVDDSIVVLENIYRRLGMGEPPAEAAEKGFKEVAVAVTAATLVAVIVFLPIAFTEGLSAQLFRNFAGTVFFALMASLVVSFTVVPMLSAKLLRADDSQRRRKRRNVFQPVQDTYARMVGWAVDNWGKTLILALLVMILTAEMIAMMFFRGKFEFIPRLIGHMYRAEVKLPAGTLFTETDKVMQDITREMSNLPDYHSFFMTVGATGDPARAAFTGGEQGPNQGELNIRMMKWAEGRTTTDEELRKIWDDLAARHPSSEIAFQQMGSMDFAAEKPIVIKIFGDDFEVMRGIADQIKDLVETVEGTRDVTTSLEDGVPELTYEFDREKLMAYMIPTGMALMEARIAIGGQLASFYREAGKEYEITVRLRKDQRDSFINIYDTMLTSPLGFQVPLRDVARFQFGEGPIEIRRENSKRLVTVEANKTDDLALGRVMQDIQESLRDLEQTLPEGYFIEFGGEAENLRDAFIDLAIMLIAAIILVYLILASLYESLIHPITIMIAIPLAFTGSVAALYITDTPFGVTAAIGMIMLVGIVATNSIVLMDFIIEFHRQGMSQREAIVEAARTRLRPILMTAFTTTFAVLPIAIGRAEGMEMQQPLGIVMVGGLVSSTLLTLIVIPVFYKLFDDFAEDMKNLLWPSRRKTKKE